MRQSVMYSHSNPLYQRAQELRNQGINPYTPNFTRSHTLLQVSELYEHIQGEEEAAVEHMHLCGRVMEVKEENTFFLISIEDQDARFQIAISKENQLAKQVSLVRNYVYRGDYLGFQVIRLCRINNMLTGITDAWCFIVLANIALPRSMDTQREKRERHLHLASNIDARERIVKRSKLLYYLRQFLHEANFLEVNPPTTFSPQAQEAFDQLSAFAAGGIEYVYQLRPVQTGKQINWFHHPNALQLEGTMMLHTLTDAMALIEALITRLTFFAQSSYTVEWPPLERLKRAQDAETEAIYSDDHSLQIDLSPSWTQATIEQLVADVLKVDFSQCHGAADVIKVVEHAGLHVRGSTMCQSVNDVVVATFRQFVAPNLIQPTFALYPTDEKTRTQAFHLIINGIVFGKGHSTSSDPLHINQDNMLLDALMVGMPPTARFTVELDGLMMLWLGAHHIQDVITFPMLSPHESKAR